jgi:WD40 repeat protein
VDSRRDRGRGRALIAVGAVSLFLLASAGPTSASPAPGGELWAARYDGPAHSTDLGLAVAISPDGTRAFVTGQSGGLGTADDYATVAYDIATGSQVWVARDSNPGGSGATAVAVSGDGATVFVTGVGPGNLSQDYITNAYAASTGVQLWTANYNGPAGGDDAAFALAPSSDGATVFVTGKSAGGATGDDYATVAYDSSTGARRWATRFSTPGDADDIASAIGVSPDGSVVFVTGQVDKLGPVEGWGTVAYDATTGGLLWGRRYTSGEGFDSAADSLALSPDGARLFVTGTIYGSATLNDMTTVAYNASTGAVAWSRRYDDPLHGYDYGFDIEASPDGTQVFVTGGGSATTGYDYITIAYSASTGAVLWGRLYDGPGGAWDLAYALAVAPDGASVFVTGRSKGITASGVDYATLAYDAATGAVLWGQRYNGPANGYDQANAIAPTPDGSTVVVAGQSLGTTTGWDYATVAYPA